MLVFLERLIGLAGDMAWVGFVAAPSDKNWRRDLARGSYSGIGAW